MFKNISLKQKYIIMFILILMGIALLIYVEIENNNTMKDTQAKYEKLIQDKRAENEKLQEKIDADIIVEQQNKILDDMFNQSLKYYESKKYASAIKSCDEILKIDKNNYKAITLKGISLCYTQKYNDGTALIDKALTIKGDYGYGIFNKALSYDLVGKYEEAKTWYNKALSIEIYPYSYYNLAVIYCRQGNLNEAINNLKQAIVLKSNLKNIAKADSKFIKIRGTKEFKEATS